MSVYFLLVLQVHFSKKYFYLRAFPRVTFTQVQNKCTCYSSGRGYTSFKIIYVALLCVLGERHIVMGNFDTLWRSVCILPTAYAASCLPLAGSTAISDGVSRRFPASTSITIVENCCCYCSLVLQCEYI